MQAFNYRPNFLARSLANRTSNSINPAVSTFGGFYSGRLLQRASRQTESYGRQLIVTDDHDAPEREQGAVQMPMDRQCGAITLYTRYMSEEVITSLINSITVPSLVVNYDVSQACDRTVLFGQEDTAYQAVNHPTSQGHSDITCVTVSGHTSIGRSRLMGYRKTLEENGIPWDPDKVKHSDPTMTRGYGTCRELLEEGVRFSALFACNDDMTLDAPKALHQAGLKIPTDVSPFDFNGTPNARWLEPGLSAVYLPVDTIITTVIDQAVWLVNGESVELIPPLAGKLVLRDSATTGPYYK